MTNIIQIKEQKPQKVTNGNLFTKKNLLTNLKQCLLNTNLKRVDVVKKNLSDEIINNKDKALIKYEKESKVTLTNLIGYMVVSILSFIALILLLDTFQIQLSSIFPNLELLLYNLYETIKDMFLFLRDLIR